MRFSVITVNLNGARYLAEAVKSVLVQDYSDIELVIVDGGSTDGSLDLIRSFAKEDERIRWRSAPDLGIADAMNKGIGLANGQWTAFLHSDDFYQGKDVLSTVAAALEPNPQSFWLTGGMLRVDSDGRELRRFRVRNYSYAWLKRSNILFHPATFVRTEVLRANQFDPALKLAMDYDLWLRLGAMADPVLLDRPLVAFRAHPESASSRAGSASLAEEYAVRRRFLKAHGGWRFWYPLDYLAKQVVGGLSSGH